ncbi:hypothetical protein LEMLEM_LOCUS9066 [Lemmus lemmus]
MSCTEGFVQYRRRESYLPCLWLGKLPAPSPQGEDQSGGGAGRGGAGLGAPCQPPEEDQRACRRFRSWHWELVPIPEEAEGGACEFQEGRGACLWWEGRGGTPARTEGRGGAPCLSGGRGRLALVAKLRRAGRQTFSIPGSAIAEVRIRAALRCAELQREGDGGEPGGLWHRWSLRAGRLRPT